MSQRRRRAGDFTDSLNSFRDTGESETDLDYDVLRLFSEDSLDEIKNRDNTVSSNTTRSSKHSIILAGSSTKDSLIQDVPDLNKRIDLFQNKKKHEHKYNIDLTHPYMGTNDKENNDPQCTVENILVHNHETSTTTLSELPSASSKEEPCSYKKLMTNNITNEKSKRDTNYNINNSAPSSNPVPEQIILKEIKDSKHSHNDTSQKSVHSVQCSSTPRSQSTSYAINDGRTDELYENEQSNNDIKKFETLLCSLDNKLNQIKEVSKPQQILRRLSDKFVHSPQNFTEKLLTIIEESVANNDEDMCGTSAIDLSRLTTEFRKMCKFIEDETIPEWPPSPMSTPPCVGQTPTSSACIRSASNKSVTTTPASAIDRMKAFRKLYHKVPKNSFTGSADNITELSLASNASFERLEAQCKRLFSKEENSPPMYKSLSLPSLLSMSDIQLICEQQMASLNDSDNILEKHVENLITFSPILSDKCSYPSKKLEKQCTQQFSSTKLQELHHKSKDLQYKNVSYSKRKSEKINLRSDPTQPETDKVTNNYLRVDPDELEKTLLQDIAEKRKRCLDTAKLITEINADPEVMGAQKPLRMSPMSSNDNDSHSMTNNETKFLNTLMSCKDYHTFLKKRRPLFSLLQNSNLSITENTPEKAVLKHDGNKKVEKTTSNIMQLPCLKDTVLRPNMKPHGVYKSPLSRKEDREVKQKIQIQKRKLFVTPGKSPGDKTCRKKPVYFPNMDIVVNNTVKKNILKSPHAEGLYRLNYNTVISPVGMYIRGIDTQLIKNVSPKTDALLLTPTKKRAEASPVGSLGRATSSASIHKTQDKLILKFELSPKICSTPNVNTNYACRKEVTTPTMCGTDNIPDHHFILPKVSYKLPLQVRTVKENRSPKVGDRRKKLLEFPQSKVVIRHEGRTNTVQKKKGEGAAEDEVCEINYKPEDESIHVEQTASKTNFIHRRKNI